MNRRTRVLATFALVGLFGPGVAWAREVSVQVDARSGPWLTRVNKKMPYGRDAGAPATVPGIDAAAKLSIYPEGTTLSPDDGAVDGSGVASKAVDDANGPRGKRYPSFYTPKILYPANLHALVAVFVDAKGVVIGRPFVVGTGVRVPVPEGASALSLGFNDASFAGNSGALKVTVELPDD